MITNTKFDNFLYFNVDSIKKATIFKSEQLVKSWLNKFNKSNLEIIEI